MFDFFKGILIEKNATYIVIECQGIGYQIYFPSKHVTKLGSVGQSILIYTSFIVRELSQALYGFLERNERDLFNQLLAISGIGPKTALALIGQFSQSDLENIVLKEESALLARVPGIGKKTAEKLLIELKGRLKLPSLSKAPSTSHAQDALSALLRLGCTQTQAEQAVQKAVLELSEEADLPSLIKSALKFKN